jgi:hypothetical protein
VVADSINESRRAGPKRESALNSASSGGCRIRFIGLTARGTCLAREAVGSRAHRDA